MCGCALAGLRAHGGCIRGSRGRVAAPLVRLGAGALRDALAGGVLPGGTERHEPEWPAQRRGCPRLDLKEATQSIDIALSRSELAAAHVVLVPPL